MRTTALRLPLLTSLAWLGILAAHAQPQWRFHLAFEDGAGARDTLWFIYDTTATTGANVDYELGEGPMPMGDGIFHVYALNAQGDSATTIAWPYALYPYFETYNTIEGINWVPPMTIRWDTSLFHAPYLPYEQGNFGSARMDGSLFFFYNNQPDLQAYNMLIDDSVFVWVDWDYLFPFSVTFEPYDGTGMDEGLQKANWFVPNPTTGLLTWAGSEPLATVRLIDLQGRSVAHYANLPPGGVIDLSGLVDGQYMVQCITTSNSVQNVRIIKQADP